MASFFRIAMAVAKKEIKTGALQGLHNAFPNVSRVASLTSRTLSRHIDHLAKTDTRAYNALNRQLDKTLHNLNPSLGKPIQQALVNINKVIRFGSEVRSTFNTARFAAHNPIRFLMHVAQPYKQLQNTTVKIVGGRVVGKHSEAYLKYSLLMDHITDRGGQVDLQAYFKPPVIRVKDAKGKFKYQEVDHPHLQQTAVTNSKSLYIAGIAVKRMVKRESNISKLFQTLDTTIHKNTERVTKERWVQLTQDVRRRYNKNVKNLANEFKAGKMTESEYKHLVAQEYVKGRRLITLLSAGGVGRIKEEGLFKLERNLKLSKEEFLKQIIDNIEQYKNIVDKQKSIEQSLRQTKKVKDVKEQKRNTSRILKNLEKEQMSRESNFNKYLRQRSVNNPEHYAINSMKQTRLRAAMRRLYQTQDMEESMKDIYDNLNLTEEQEQEVTDFFNKEFRKIHDSLKNSSDAESVIEKMETQLLKVPETQHELIYEPVFRGEVGVDPLTVMVGDKAEIEKGYKDGRQLDADAIVDNVQENSGDEYVVAYERQITDGENCVVCEELNLTVYQYKDEAYAGHALCYNSVYNGEGCYCEVYTILLSKSDYNDYFSAEKDTGD